MNNYKFFFQQYVQRSQMFLAVLMVVLLSACSEKEEFLDPIINNPLPIGKKELRVLAIGNSYTLDATMYLQEILDNAGIDPNTYSIYLLYQGGSSLEFWSKRLKRSDSWELMQRAGALPIERQNGTIAELLAQPWDIIVVQQLSKDAIYYDTFNPYLRHIIHTAKSLCPNKAMALAWHEIHAYASFYDENNGMTCEERWQAICNATNEMVRNDGINIVIPMGTAIENARHSTLQNDTELTRDGTHLAFGVGRYIAACAWVETLFAPVFGFSISNLTATHDLEEWEEFGIGVDAFIPGSSEAVTDDNRPLCLQCVNMASLHPYSIVNP